jgi:hypothetical protein
VGRSAAVGPAHDQAPQASDFSPLLTRLVYNALTEIRLDSFVITPK